MQVEWKLPFCVAFCLAMCLIEYVFGNILQKGEYDTLPELKHETHFVDKTGFWFWFGFDWNRIVMWWLVSMIATLGFFFLNDSGKINKILGKQEVKCESTSQINLPNDLVKNVGTNYMENDGDSIACNRREEIKPLRNCSNLLDAVKDFSCNLEKREISLHHTEKCTKISNEQHESNFSKDFASLTRKYELVCNENKKLAEELSQAQKDNLNYKQNLNDTLREKTKLLKRLKSATRLIEENETNSQMFLNKLKENFAESEEMKIKVKQLTKDRFDLDQKMQLLKQRYKNFQNQTGELHKHTLSKLSEPFEELRNDYDKESYLKEPEVDVGDLNNIRINTNPTQEIDGQFEDLSNEDLIFNNDIKKRFERGEEKLNNLLNQVCVNYENKKEQKEISPTKNNTTQEINESFYTSVRPNVIPLSDSHISTEYSSSEITISSEIKSEVDFSIKSGIVSRSPVFKQFLLKVLDGTHS